MSNISNAELPLFYSVSGGLTRGDLTTNADSVVLTLGAGAGGSSQETPEYLLQLAEAHPDRKIEMIHCDKAFGRYVKEWLACKGQEPLEGPWCLSHEKEWKLLSVKNGELTFQHNRLHNVMVRILNKDVPGENKPPFFEDLSGFVGGLLGRGSEVFLGVHTECYRDVNQTFSSVYNSLRERFSGKLHLYIQAADHGTYVYTGKYHPIFGEFAEDIDRWNPIWGGKKAFQHVFSEVTPSQSDRDMIRQCMDNFIEESRMPDATTPKKKLQSYQGGMMLVDYGRSFKQSVSEDEEGILRSYLDPASQYQVQYVTKVTPGTFGYSEVSPRTSQESKTTSLFFRAMSFLSTPVKYCWQRVMNIFKRIFHWGLPLS